MQWYFPHMKVTWYKLRCVLHIFAVLGPNLNRFPMVVVAATSPNVDPVSHYCIVIDVGRRQQQQQQDCNYECNQIYFLTRSPFRQSADDDDDAPAISNPYLSSSVWPNDWIKSSPIFKSDPSNDHSIFYLNSDLIHNSPKHHQKICRQESSRIARSDHTAPEFKSQLGSYCQHNLCT